MSCENVKVSILDCTLRDGGHVNDFNFGFERAKRITSGLTDAGINYIELGFFRDGEYDVNRTIFQRVEQAERLIPEDTRLSQFSIMIRPDWVSIESLGASTSIGCIRFAFHAKDLDLTLRQANVAMDLGYRVFLNPVNITSYNDHDVTNILASIKSVGASGVSIVDTFGSMQELDLYRLVHLFHRGLEPEVTIGLHLHENLASSFLLAQKFLEILPSSRNCIIDSSTLGLGRIPGNLQTEQIAQHLNSCGADYDLKSIFKVAYNEILPLKESFSWGYSPEYAASAALGVHRSYAEYAVATCALPYDQAYELMCEVAACGKGQTFDEEFFQKLIKAL